MSSVLLEVNDLKTYFHTRSGVAKAVDGLSFKAEKGKTLAIVGESGSGKSVSMLSLLGLIPCPPGRIESGSAIFEGKDLLKISKEDLRDIRGSKISMIFQDPMTSLNPYLKISTQLTEAVFAHNKTITNKEVRKKAIESLELVGIPNAADRVDCYPHEFSGGMRQRVMIAMALINRPQIVIADEPTTALDVTIQAQILRLLKDIQSELHMSVILITHDLGVVAGVADKVSVMYAGKVVEEGTVEDIFYRSSHPYTMGLLSSTPRLDQKKDSLTAISGLPPDPSNLPLGCPFAPRCSKVMNSCRLEDPLPIKSYSHKHKALCYWEKGHE